VSFPDLASFVRMYSKYDRQSLIGDTTKVKGKVDHAAQESVALFWALSP